MNFQIAKELILKDLESRNLWSLFVIQRILSKARKLVTETVSS